MTGRADIADRLAACPARCAADMAAILDETPHPSLTVEPTEARRGGLSLRVDGRWVHSSVDPLKEAQRAVAGAGKDDNPAEGPYDGTVVVGLGLGYLLEALDDRDEHTATPRPLVVVVFHPSVLYAALLHRTADWWRRHAPERVVPAWLPGVIMPVLQELEVRSFRVLHVGGCISCFPDAARTVMETLDRYRGRIEVNRNTLRRFGHLWVRNTMHTVCRHGLLPGIEPLADAARNVPAVVVAAGPTLDEALPHLETLKEYSLIIAVDTAVIALERAGVFADIAVISDPQYWNTRHLDHVRGGGKRGPLLIAEPATHPRTLRLWRGPRAVSASLFPLGTFFDVRAGRTKKLGAGGSVATSAWDLARVMGSTTIALVGVDLGFPGGRTHCAGSFFEERLALAGTRLSPAEGGLWHYLHGAQASTVPAADGTPIPSDRRMQVYRSWFEEQNQRFPEVETVLLSPRSSAIPGIDVRTIPQWRAALSSHPRPTEARNRIAGADQWAHGEATSMIAELRRTLEGMCAIAEDGLTHCREIRARGVRHGDGAVRTGLAQLDAIDRRIEAFADRELAGFIAGEAIERSVSAAPTTPREALDQARSIYAALRDAATYHLSLLNRYDCT